NDATASFGDIKTAAKLIRRAKRRCRPLCWQAWWWASRSVATLLAVYALMACWLAGVKPTIATDYLAKLNEPLARVPEADRAWPLYVEALEPLYRNPLREDAEPPTHNYWEPDWEQLDESRIDAWLDARQDLVKRFRSAAAKPSMGATLGPDGAEHDHRRLLALRAEAIGVELNAAETDPNAPTYSILLPHVQEMRSVARVLQQDAVAAARRGDRETFVADITAMLGVAKHAGQAADFLVAGLVRVAVQRMAIETLTEQMQTNPGLLTSDDLTRLAHAFAAIEYPADRWLDGERIMFRDMVQRVYSDDGDGDGFLTAEGVRWLRELSSSLSGDPVQAIETQIPGALAAAAPAFYLAAASRREVLAAFDRFHAAALADATRPLWQWEHRKGAASHFFDGSIFSTPTQRLRFYPVGMLAPAVRAASQAFHRSLARRDGVLVGLALELYRRDQGHYPDTLEELSPRWLPKAPVDPINGGPLGYRITGGKPVVYSLGIDTDDDGGRLPAYMNDAENESLGFSTTDRYRVGPPLTQEELTKPRPNGDIGHDGDWVLWSLAEPSFVPRGD
ncbi:MAG: hypothetical protein AAF596_10260, partial [Planctomycetota bacterium]